MKKYIVIRWDLPAKQSKPTRSLKCKETNNDLGFFILCGISWLLFFHCYRCEPWLFWMWSRGYEIYLHMADPRTNPCIPWGGIGSRVYVFESVALARLAFQPNAFVSKVISQDSIHKLVNIRTKNMSSVCLSSESAVCIHSRKATMRFQVGLRPRAKASVFL